MFKTIQNIHFVGIGGSGMSGIAEVLLNLGYHVSGSDMKQSETSLRLAKLGATIFYGHKESHVGTAQVVVASTAVKPDNPEVIYAKKHKISHSNAINKAHRQTIEAFLEKGVWKIGDDPDKN